MGGPATVASILDAARARTGLDDLGDDWFLGPLDAWVEDLRQPHLNDFGRAFMTRLAQRDVERRLRVMAALREHPEIEEVPLPPIVYVTGLARSGTTLLHNLLSIDQRARPLLRWELVEPLPPPTAASHDHDPRIESVRAALDPLRGSLLEHMHWVEADDPEECVWGYLDALGMLGQAPTQWMPAWREVLTEGDWTPALRNYRRLVQLLLWRNPVPEDGFLVLKAPQVSGQVDRVAEVFPEARFVVTDRDPFRTTVSLAVLAAAIADPFFHENPLADDGRRDRIALTMNCNSLAALDDSTTCMPHRILHVRYAELVDDPIGVVRSILPDTGRELDGAVHRFLDAQRNGARAAPPATLDPMGYDRDEVWGAPVIEAYCRRFGIEPELVRKASAARGA